MQSKTEREAVAETEVPKVDPNDPTQILVEGPEGRIIDFENRRGFGQQVQKLAYPNRPNFHRHWFNDEPGRLALAADAGYTKVLDAHGKPVAMVVDKQTGMFAYLHEIPEPWYKADLAAAQKVADERMSQLRSGNAAGPGGTDLPGIDGKNYYGKISIGRKATG